MPSDSQHDACRARRNTIVWILLIFGVAFVLIAMASHAFAHMHDRPDLNDWFGGLSSKKGLCCSMVDGTAISDVDWDTADACERVTGGSGVTQACHTHYRVKLKKEWVVVPDSAVLTEPNRYGPTLVWPYVNSDGEQSIKCFMPGAGG